MYHEEVPAVQYCVDQVTSALLFIFCYCIFLFATRPYLDDADDILQALLNVVLFCIICGTPITTLMPGISVFV